MGVRFLRFWQKLRLPSIWVLHSTPGRRPFSRMAQASKPCAQLAGSCEEHAATLVVLDLGQRPDPPEATMAEISSVLPYRLAWVLNLPIDSKRPIGDSFPTSSWKSLMLELLLSGMKTVKVSKVTEWSSLKPNTASPIPTVTPVLSSPSTIFSARKRPGRNELASVLRR